MTDTERIEELELVVVFLVDKLVRLGSAVPPELNIMRERVEGREAAKRRGSST